MIAPTFLKVKRGSYPSQGLTNVIALREDNWDDYGFKTMFHASYFDEQGIEYALGEIKIGYLEQQIGWTSEKIPFAFTELSAEFFSVGQSSDYYSNLRKLVKEYRHILTALRDIAANTELRSIAYASKVFEDSLTRTVSVLTIEHQFHRIVQGGVVLSPFDFKYKREASELLSGIDLDFSVLPESTPPTNIHVIIGRNGVGKTTVLNGMASAIADKAAMTPENGRFFTPNIFVDTHISEDYFSSVSSVSFSAFDPFDPPPDRRSRSGGPSYFYIGLKRRRDRVENNRSDAPELRDFDELAADFSKSLTVCMSQDASREKWLKCISILESDPNFEEMRLRERATDDQAASNDGLFNLFRRKMSSGHAVVLLTITKLVETVEEKTLVLIDEPESHLHPPLLAAFTRALSFLLTATNAVAIVATHSPVVLQEVPRQCVWKLRRARLATVAERPERETFGENVGVLTREVFGLEVSKSGFHALLAEAVGRGSTFEEVMADYSDKIGMEGQVVVRALVAARDSDAGKK